MHASLTTQKTSPAQTNTYPSTPVRRPGCVEFAGVFQHPLMEDPPGTGGTAEDRRTAATLTRQAENVCAACPVLADCLFRAVVEHDVAGFAGATTARQRSEIRRRLRVSVAPEDFDTLAGVVGRHRQVDHDEVVRLRHANPHESLEQLAHRLGCSLSTVKRHLRRERSTPSTAKLAAPKPTRGQVMVVAAEVIGVRRTARAA